MWHSRFLKLELFFFFFLEIFLSTFFLRRPLKTSSTNSSCGIHIISKLIYLMVAACSFMCVCVSERFTLPQKGASQTHPSHNPACCSTLIELSFGFLESKFLSRLFMLLISMATSLGEAVSFNTPVKIPANLSHLCRSHIENIAL